MSKTEQTPKTKKKTKKPMASLAMSKVSITLHDHEYTVACDAGEEKKLGTLVKFVNDKLDKVSLTGTNATENRLFMLTCLLLADELIETRKAVKAMRQDDEHLMIAAVDHLCDRVNTISQAIGKA